jgi:20S proteasome alpha/beta subunit
MQRPRLGIIASSYENEIISTKKDKQNIHPSIQGMVKILATRDDSTKPTSTTTPRHSPHTALIATGIQSDISHLLNQLQTHVISKFWFRYDTYPPREGMIQMVKDVLLDFLGYDRKEEGSAVSGGSAAPSSHEDGVRAGRPLGVCTFLLSLEDTPSLTVIEANGSWERYVAHAMGVGATVGNARLSQQWRRGMSVAEAKGMMREIFREIAVEKGWLNEDDEMQSTSVTDDDISKSLGENFGSDVTIVCETVTREGIDIEYLNSR